MPGHSQPFLGLDTPVLKLCDPSGGWELPETSWVWSERDALGVQGGGERAPTRNTLEPGSFLFF